MSAVVALGRGAQRAIVIGFLAALFVHGTAAARAAVIPIELMDWSQRIGRAVHDRVFETYDIEVFKPPEPPPTPPEPPEPVKDEPKEVPLASAPPSMKKPSEAAPTAAAAQAGAVLTQAPDPNEPVDLTNAFVNGQSDTYAGGVTQSTGTSGVAVYAQRVGPGGTPSKGAGRTDGPVSGAPDRSRPASLAGSKDWKCDFPPEADIDQIDEAFVVVQVATRADGSPERVNVISDPGHGFGRAARLCAMKERYDPALDRDGNAVAGGTKSIRIRFER
jgi:protein TonB